MGDREHLSVDLANPEDIRAKLPEARSLYVSKRKALDEMQAEVDRWGDLVNMLARMVGEPPVAKEAEKGRRSSGGKKSPGQDRAVAGLEAAGQPMGPAKLFRFMLSRDMDVPTNANALGAALWSAANAGRVKKTPDGLYAPLGWSGQAELATDGTTSSNPEGRIAPAGG